MGATGPSCSCSCGGSNHGGVWSETGEILAGALARYRAELAAKQANRDCEARRQRESRDAAFNAWRAEHEATVSELLAGDWLAGQFPNDFLADLTDQLSEHKPLSDRQIDAAERTLAKRHAATKRTAERKATATEVPAGRLTVEGTIVGIFEVPDNFSYYDRTIVKMIVDTGTYTVMGTVPTSTILEVREYEIKNHTTYNGPRDLKGHKVQFTATITPGSELGKGYFKRPTKVTVTDIAACPER